MRQALAAWVLRTQKYSSFELVGFQTKSTRVSKLMRFQRKATELAWLLG